MTVGRPSASREEEQALAQCAALVGVGPAKAIIMGKLLETHHAGNVRVLGRLAQSYAELGLTAEAARVGRRIDELHEANSLPAPPIPPAPPTGFDGRAKASRPVSLPPPP